MIAYFTSDLLWSSRIAAAARAQGVEASPLRDLDQARQCLQDSPFVGVAIDLDDPDRALPLIEWLRTEHPEIRILAFGPHVDRITLDKARELGAHQTLPRSAVSKKLDDLIIWLNTTTNGSD